MKDARMLLVLGVALATAAVFAATASAGTGLTIISRGISSFQAAPQGTPTGAQSDEISGLDESDADSDAGDDEGGGVNRTIPSAHVATTGPSVIGGKKAKSNPEVQVGWDGLNFFDQRFANNGNQFSVEPPDQGLCAGNGYVLESVNDVLKVFDASGNTVLGTVDLNTFYHYPAAIDRTKTPPVRGPSITDPVCYYDSPTGRWFQVVLTLEQTAAGALTGPNHLDIAVSNTSNPLGTWTLYSVPAQNDGTQGTPDHGCKRRVSGVLVHGPCLADFPHIGADRNGVYITANEFYLFSPGSFVGAEVYSFSKQALEAGGMSVSTDLISTVGVGPDGAGFTLWPATTPGNQYSDDANGTEYFLSSRAVFTGDGASDSILVWRETNTASLNDATPNVGLTPEAVGVDEYGVPARSSQKAGDIPLGNCATDTTGTNTTPPVGCPVATGAVFRPDHPGPEIESQLDSSDSRFLGVTYANGKLWGTLGTAADVGGANHAAAAWYILKPSSGGTQVSKQGVLALDGNNLTYPTVGVTRNGRGVLAFTLVGNDYYPSAAYASLDDKAGAGDIHVAAEGADAQDGFTGYWRFRAAPLALRPRWGDYGGAAVDGNNVFVASEYIAHACDYATYKATNGTCGNTRGPLGNWATRITKLVP
jgi:hypothetical protein